jgi:hypothetical protein
MSAHETPGSTGQQRWPVGENVMSEGDAMKSVHLMAAGVALFALAMAGPAMAQKKTLAVVVKGLDNPFFTVLGDGYLDKCPAK